MYSKAEASQLRKEFWTSFGLYMSPVLSAEGEKINWINYRTGEKNIFFKMETHHRSATVAIEIAHPDIELQQLYFEQFEQLKKILHNTLGEQWEWSLHYTDEYGKVTSRIYTELPGVSVLNKANWPALISFFKPRIIALDEFWSNAKYGFEELR